MEHINERSHESRMMTSRRAERRMTDWQTKSVDNWLNEHFSGERNNSFDSDQRPSIEHTQTSSGDNIIVESFIKDKQAGKYYFKPSKNENICTIHFQDLFYFVPFVCKLNT